MKRPSFLNKHRKNNGYELNTSTSSSYSDATSNNNTSNKEKVVLSSIAVLCNESKSHTKKHNTNRSSNNSDVVSPHTVPSNNSSSHHVDGGISSNNCGVGLSTKLADTNADELVLNSTTLLNNISLEDSYSTSEEGGKVLPSSVAVFVDDLILCGDKQHDSNPCSSKQSTKKSTTSVHQPMVIAKEEVEGEGGGEVSPTNVTEFNVSFGSADFDYFVGNRFTDLSANDNEQGNETEHEKEKKTSESNSNKETNESINNKKADNVRYTMVDNNKTSKGGKKARKKEGKNNNKSSLAEFSNTYNDDTFSISLASTTNNSNDTSSSYTRRASIDSSASQQYINEHIQILLDTILLPTSMLLPKSVKKEVSNTILPAFKSTANDVTDNIELILTLPADYIANALNTSTSTSNNDEMKKVDSSSSSSKMSVSSFMNSVNAGYESVSKSSRNVVSKQSSLLNESNISNETIKTSNLLLCGTSGGSSCIERDFLYNTCVDQ